MRQLWWPTTIVCAVLSGCAWQTPKPFIKQVDMGAVHAVSLDIKQRMVFERDIPGGSGTTTSTIVCPEPSPDALTATAASLNLDASGAEKAISQFSGGGTTGETSAMVGLRTQSIQLLRDQLTHLCLGYMNNALAPGTYALLLRREQRLTLGLLAVEQLTGAAVAQTQIVNSPGVSSGGSPAPKSPSGTTPSGTTPSGTSPTDTNPAGATSPPKPSGATKPKSPSGADSADGNPSATGLYELGEAAAYRFIAVANTVPPTPVPPPPAQNPKSGSTSPKAPKKPGGGGTPPSTPSNPGSASPPTTTPDDTAGTKSASKDIAALAPAVQSIVNDVLTTGFEEEECLAVLALDGSTGADGKPVTIGEVAKVYCDNILQIGVQKTDAVKASQEAGAPSPSVGSPSASQVSQLQNPDPRLAANPKSTPKARTADAANSSATNPKQVGLDHERLGFAALQSFDYANAATQFKAADAAYPTLGNASELSALLTSLGTTPSSAQECSTIKTISDLYRWRLPGMTKIALHGKYDQLNCTNGQLKF